MNEFLPSQFIERVERLWLGIEPRDALSAGRIAHPIDLVLDGVPYPQSALPDRNPSWETVLGFPDSIGVLTQDTAPQLLQTRAAFQTRKSNHPSSSECLTGSVALCHAASAIRFPLTCAHLSPRASSGALPGFGLRCESNRHGDAWARDLESRALPTKCQPDGYASKRESTVR